MQNYIGRWRITWMEEWDQEFVDLIEPGYFNFAEDDLGEFAFGAVQGGLDVRVSADRKRIEFSWAGNDDGREKSGRGWFEFTESDTGKGHFFIHRGDDSAIEIHREA